MFGFFRRKSTKKNTEENDSAKDEMIDQVISQLFAKDENRDINVQVAKQMIQARYKVEHILLKKYLYEDTKLFLDTITKENSMYTLYKTVIESECGIFPYSCSQFNVKTKKSDELILVSALLPEPEAEPLCRRLYFVCNKNYEKAMCFTVEKGMNGDFLCCWDGKRHLNMGQADEIAVSENGGQNMGCNDEEISRIIKLYQSINNRE